MKQYDNRKLIKQVDQFFANKAQIELLTQQNEALLEQLWDSVGQEDCLVGNHKLQMVERKGSVSYASIVKEHLPKVDLDKYRGAPSSFIKLS